MASHHLHPTVRPRSLANIRADLLEADRDYRDALADCLTDEDAQDRCTEAETRRSDLCDEFHERFQAECGITVEQLLKLREEAVL